MRDEYHPQKLKFVLYLNHEIVYCFTKTNFIVIKRYQTSLFGRYFCVFRYF